MAMQTLPLLAVALSAFPQPLTPVSVADAVQEFRTLCVDTLGEPSAFAAKRDASAWGYRPRKESPAMLRQPGDGWDAERAILFHASADWLPKDLPSPQCRLSVAASGVSLPTALDEIGAQLGLGKPRVEGRAPEMRATWIVGEKGQTRSQISAIIELMGDEPADLTLNLSRLRN
jgi:hypothetical protein